MIIVPAGLGEAAALAEIHAAAFARGWSASEIVILIAQPGTLALAARRDDGLAGFLLLRQAADEAEILTLAVAPACRRQGAARALVAAAIAWAREQGAAKLFLEVDAGNDAALGLYEEAGFARVGRRAAYYAQDAGGGDALVLRLDLNS
jgi:ribosomal-protein-alanine N-acetyltransferase